MANAKADEKATTNAKADEKANAEAINLADVKAQVEAMLEQAREKLEQAREEADKIIADAKASVSGEKTEEQKKAEEERNAYWDEYVEVELFKDNNKYKDDVPVGVNGEICLIQRGQKVKVKRKFAKVLEDSKIQDFKTSELIDQKANEFAKSGL